MFARTFVLLLSSALLPVSALAQTPAPAQPTVTQPVPAQPADGGPRVKLVTSMGEIVLELYPDKAPRTVRNFLDYVEDGFYNGTIFHRIIADLLIQGGAYTIDMQPKPTRGPIPLESNNGLSNLRGTVVAARAQQPESATSQFFINTVDNPRFDYTSDQNDYTRGYAVFGKVVEGMDVVDKIRAVPTQAQKPFPRDVPKTPVTIERVEAVEAE